MRIFHVAGLVAATVVTLAASARPRCRRYHLSVVRQLWRREAWWRPETAGSYRGSSAS